MSRPVFFNFRLLIVFSFVFIGIILPGCSNETGNPKPVLETSSPDPSTTVRPVAVTAVIVDSYSRQIGGRRFTVQSGNGSRSRVLTDARGTLSLRLTPGINYKLQSVEGEDSSVGFLEINVNASGEVSVTNARNIYATELQAHRPGETGSNSSAAKFQSARFGDSVFAP